MAETRTHKTALTLAIVLATFLAIVMLLPVGNDEEAVSQPDGSKIMTPYSWSIGSMLVLGPISGGNLQNLSPVSIILGIAIAFMGSRAIYVLVRKRAPG